MATKYGCKEGQRYDKKLKKCVSSPKPTKAQDKVPAKAQPDQYSYAGPQNKERWEATTTKRERKRRKK